MKTHETKRRIGLIAGSLRLMACALENAEEPNQFRSILLALENAISLIQLCFFEYQKQMIANSKHDFDSTEIKGERL